MEKLRQVVKKLFGRAGGADNISMRSHIRLYLYIYGVVALLALVLILLFTDNLIPNTRNVTSSMQLDSEKTAANINTHLGGIAAKSINLSKTLSADLEAALRDRELSFSDKAALAAHIPDLLDQEIDLLLLALERADCSGVYIVLDATVNPLLPAAETSRAGIYIRRVEPNRIGNPSEMLLLRGSTDSGVRRGMTLQASWDLEFDIGECGFWERPLTTYATAPERKLANLYVWTLETIIPRSGEASLLCTVPLLDSSGALLGVCGLELTEIGFQNTHALDSARYPDLTLMFSELKNGALDLEHALFSGSRKNVPAFRAQGTAPLTAGAENPEQLFWADERYRVVCDRVSLYMDTSRYADQEFAVAVSLSEAVYRQEITADVLRGIAIFSGMLLLGWVLSHILGRRLERPFTATIEAVKGSESEPGGEMRVGIWELDEMLRITAELVSGQTAHVGELFSGFLEKLELLTPKEREIVARYALGKGQEDILAEMFIAPSTLKTHNLHIYAKLAVKSIDELRLYLNLISRTSAQDRLRQLLDLPRGQEQDSFTLRQGG